MQTATTAITAQLLIHNGRDRTITEVSRRKHTNALYNSFDVSAVNVTASRVTWEMGLGEFFDYLVAVEDPTAVDGTVPGWDAGVPTQREVCSSMLSLFLPDFRQDTDCTLEL